MGKKVEKATEFMDKEDSRHVFNLPLAEIFCTYSKVNKVNRAPGTVCTQSRCEERLEFKHFVIVLVIYL